MFVECAHFVHRLKSGTRTAWVISGVGNHRTALLNFKRWGEVIGAKLQDILTKERQPVVSYNLSLTVQYRSVCSDLHICVYH